jgi:acetyl-CoA carboxylase biotin carboxyl carrier protein
MNIADIEKLVDLVARSQVAEVTLESETRRITVRKGQSRAEMTAVSSSTDAIASVEVPTIEATVNSDEFGAPLETIIAPMVGIFHDSEPPVGVGSKVEIGHVVGIIESMKLMNDIRAERAGIVREVHVEPGVAVEYGQPLFELETH